METPAPAEQPAAHPSEAIRVLQDQLRESRYKPHWPMYLRTFKQFLRSLQPPFDERQYGLSSTYDLVRQAQKEDLLRVERNRQGILRIFPAEHYPQAIPEQPAEEPIPVEEVQPEFTIPSPELEIPFPDQESGSVMQAGPPEAVEEFPVEAAESAPETAPEMQPGAKKPRAKRPRKAAASASAKSAKGEGRKTKTKEKTKDAGQSRTSTD
jgi:hypothetical protein